MSVVGAAVRILCAALDAALPDPAIHEAYRHADLLAEAEEEREVFEASGPNGTGWRPSHPKQTIYRRPGFMYGALIPASLCATEGKPCDPICGECRTSPVAAGSQEAATTVGGAVGVADSHSGSNPDRPNSDLYRALASTILRLQKHGPDSGEAFLAVLNSLVEQAYERARMFDDIED